VEVATSAVVTRVGAGADAMAVCVPVPARIHWQMAQEASGSFELAGPSGLTWAVADDAETGPAIRRCRWTKSTNTDNSRYGKNAATSALRRRVKPAKLITLGGLYHPGMTCRTCGTEIADKAIICYRCGTATAEPARKPAEIRPRRSAVLPATVLILLALLAWFFGHTYHVFGLSLTLPPDAWAPVLVDFFRINA
jgi:hypothetical protein